jgi:hypothetical protein
MRRLLVPLVLTVLALAGCGDDDDDPAAGGEDTEETTGSTAAEVKRLECPGEVQTFEVTGAAVGSTLPSYTSSDEAAQAAVDADEEAESYVEVGEDPDGVRYALLDASGTVVSEMVFRDEGGDWTVASEDTCA